MSNWSVSDTILAVTAFILAIPALISMVRWCSGVRADLQSIAVRLDLSNAVLAARLDAVLKENVACEADRTKVWEKLTAQGEAIAELRARAK